MILLICTAGERSKYEEYIPKMQELDKATFNPDVLETPEGFIHSIFSTASTIFLLVESGELYGYALVNIMTDSHLAYVSNLIVDPKYRRDGYGRYLMDAIVSHIDIKYNSTMDIKLDVDSSNVPAKKLYESFGFDVTYLTMVRKPNQKPREVDNARLALEELRFDELDNLGGISVGLLTRAISDAILNPGELCILDYAEVQEKQTIIELVNETYPALLKLLVVEELDCKMVGDKFIIAYGFKHLWKLTVDTLPKLYLIDGIGYLEKGESGTNRNIHPVYTRNGILK